MAFSDAFISSRLFSDSTEGAGTIAVLAASGSSDGTSDGTGVLSISSTGADATAVPAGSAGVAAEPAAVAAGSAQPAGSAAQAAGADDERAAELLAAGRGAVGSCAGTGARAAKQRAAARSLKQIN